MKAFCIAFVLTRSPRINSYKEPSPPLPVNNIIHYQKKSMNLAETAFLFTGIGLLLLVVFDFFFTTLSGSGAGFITRFVSFLALSFLLFWVKHLGRRVYSISGMVVNLMVLTVWVVSIWAGVFFVFSSDPEGIVASNNRSATVVERLYFTGYTISTLGLGDFQPTTPVFKLLTSSFSFFGFVFFTTSMTYLISLSSAVIHKRSLALAINNLGKNPDDLVSNLLEKNPTYCLERFSSLQNMIDRHSVNHEAYPVLHFYGNRHPESSLSINLATLDEAITILLETEKGEPFRAELEPLRNSISNFLNHIKQRYSRTVHSGENTSLNFPTERIDNQLTASEDHDERRKVLGGLLKSESFSWADVYSDG